MKWRGCCIMPSKLLDMQVVQEACFQIFGRGNIFFLVEFISPSDISLH